MDTKNPVSFKDIVAKIKAAQEAKKTEEATNQENKSQTMAKLLAQREAFIKMIKAKKEDK